jgi:ATP-binding cassette subfamily C protein CydCD
MPPINVSLELAPGEWGLVTGPSGSGKTTLASVLVRFLEASAGSVELVGAGRAASLAELDEDDGRGAIGLAVQDVHVFDTTIEQNLRLARPGVDDRDLADAVRTAGLAAWIASLPAGLQTPVGELGARLSGGQRQRIGLARAVLADRPIMIFDEPTEHLDPRTAERLTEDLLRLAARRTTIFITHRPELIAALERHPLRRVDLGPADAPQ